MSKSHVHSHKHHVYVEYVSRGKEQTLFYCRWVGSVVTKNSGFSEINSLWKNVIVISYAMQI